MWHRNGTWRRKEEPPSPDYDPSRWGYPDLRPPHQLAPLLEVLARASWPSWRATRSTSPTGSSGPRPRRYSGSGGVYRCKDGDARSPTTSTRTFEYPGGRTAVFTSIESNAFDHYYETYYGTKGTLILRGETEAYLFDEGGGDKATAVEVAAKGSRGR